MDYAVIEEYAFIAAGSLIQPKKIIKSQELWMGSPAKFVRYLTDQDLEYMQDNVRNYVELANVYKILVKLRLSTFHLSRVYKESLNALTVFLSKNAIVIGPMPPGTGVIYFTLD